MLRGPVSPKARVWILCATCFVKSRVWSPTPVGLIICPNCKSKNVSRVA